jgi:hypothetical protein
MEFLVGTTRIYRLAAAIRSKSAIRNAYFYRFFR